MHMYSSIAACSDRNRLDEAGMLLRQCFITIQKGVEREIQQAGVNFCQWQALRLLAAKDQLAVGDLARELEIVSSTATRLADQLEERSLVSRLRLTIDRRVVDLRITERGRTLAAQVEPLARRFWSRQFQCFSERDLSMLCGLLTRIHNPSDPDAQPNAGSVPRSIVSSQQRI